MRILIPIVAIIVLILCFCFLLIIPAHAQTNSPDVALQISNLTAQVAALQKQATPSNAVLESITFSNGVAVSTNAVSQSATVSSEFQPILNLLGGKTQSLLATVMAWFLAVSTLVAPWRTKIKHLISDKFNEVAANSSADQNAYLRTLFGKSWYKLAALTLAFAGITLPNAADLDRVIAAQNEAALTATQRLLAQTPPPAAPVAVPPPAATV